jgi:hypothetical protein
MEIPPPNYSKNSTFSTTSSVPLFKGQLPQSNYYPGTITSSSPQNSHLFSLFVCCLNFNKDLSASNNYMSKALAKLV